MIERNSEIYLMEELETKKIADDVAEPASLMRIFFARVVDLIISLVPGMFFSFFYHAHDVKSAAIIVGSSFAIMFFYFIVLAYWCHGNTIGKLMLGIKIQHPDGTKPKFREVFGRELYHVFVPWFIQLFLQIIILVIAYELNPDGANKTYSTICYALQNIESLFYLVWFLYIGLTIKAQADHQSGVDHKFQLFCRYVGYTKTTRKVEEKELKHHVHLDENMPGNFDVSEIDKMLEEKDDESK
jgi:uncharacterized RDD family membrane protein YckC